MQSDGFDYALDDISCPTLSIPSFTVAFSAPSDIEVDMSGVTIECGASYSYYPKAYVP